ncbi:MAG: homoserine dehydrogenase [Propionivibrio sp.]
MKPAIAPFPVHEPLRVGLLGIGTVGGGTCRVLKRNRQIIGARAGRAIELRALSTRTLARAHGVVDREVELIADPAMLVRRPDIDVVVEAIGGCTAARRLVLDAIAHGKHVVTANKALLAMHGEEIFAAARSQGVAVAYEGAVAVSIPIVKALREGLAANQIDWLAGIVNGTSNFILTRMRDAGLSFADALKEAQALGYAETDPTLDVGGFDAAHKLALLASLAFGMPLRLDKITIEGIAAVQPIDQRLAARLGYAVKSLAVARRQPEGVELRVHPALVPLSSLMAHVDGVMNGILVGSDAAGLTMHYGAGAGSEQTASAVIADLIDIARLGRPDVREAREARQAIPSLGVPHEALAELPVIPSDDIVSRHYLRVASASDDAAARAIAGLKQHGIDIEARLDPAAEESAERGHLALVTGPVHEGRMRTVCALLEASNGEGLCIARLRVENLPPA